MLKYAAAVGLLMLTPMLAEAAGKPKKTRFWNLTGETVSKFELSPAGTTNFGADQCKNDKDGTVEYDERLPIEGVEAGQYDARIGYPSGRVCFAKGIKVEAGGIFSIEQDQLKDCTGGK
jgi:hypothetical protein